MDLNYLLNESEHENDGGEQLDNTVILNPLGNPSSEDSFIDIVIEMLF